MAHTAFQPLIRSSVRPIQIVQMPYAKSLSQENFLIATP